MAPPKALDRKRREFEREALPHLDTLYNVALRYTGHRPEAEDLVQETMLKAYRSWDRYELGTNARAWLLTILRNAFIGQHRRRKRQGRHMTNLSDVDETVDGEGLSQEETERRFLGRLTETRVAEAIQALPAKFREALVLRSLEGMSYEEVASGMGVPVGTVKSRLARARRTLRRDLHDDRVGMGYGGSDRAPAPASKRK